MNINELLSKLNGEDLGMLIMMGSLFFIAFTAIIGGCVVKIVKSNNETRLKQEMIARGMSAEEMKAVLQLGSKK